MTYSHYFTGKYLFMKKAVDKYNSLDSTISCFMIYAGT